MYVFYGALPCVGGQENAVSTDSGWVPGYSGGETWWQCHFLITEAHITRDRNGLINLKRAKFLFQVLVNFYREIIMTRTNKLAWQSPGTFVMLVSFRTLWNLSTPGATQLPNKRWALHMLPSTVAQLICLKSVQEALCIYLIYIYVCSNLFMQIIWKPWYICMSA